MINIQEMKKQEKKINIVLKDNLCMSKVLLY